MMNILLKPLWWLYNIYAILVFIVIMLLIFPFIINAEFILNSETAFQSNLKLTEAGYRNAATGVVYPDFVGGYYWTSKAGNGNVANKFFFEPEGYFPETTPMERGYAIPCRCVK